MIATAYPFEPAEYEHEILAIVRAVDEQTRDGASLAPAALARIVRQHPKDGCGLFSKSEIVRGFRYLTRKYELDLDESRLLAQLRMKPIRTASGVAPVTVLTKPYPCPGRCIFCPSDVRMPKSYLSDEPGARRAAQHQFDPYRQTRARLEALRNIGHRVDKVEMIILGGTWSSYPIDYQRWFVKRCFDAMNDMAAVVGGATVAWSDPDSDPGARPVPVPDEVDGRTADERSYNQAMAELPEALDLDYEQATWEELEAVQKINETTHARAVGLVLETRPDRLTENEVRDLRRLGATKIQIGIQTLDDRVLELNHRGHSSDRTRQAFALLRAAGFKIHAHWMPNLYGSDPDNDKSDYLRLFEDPAIRPDELKIYPCSLIESAELMAYYERGEWRPYSEQELLDVLCSCLAATPRYCRLTRVIRDIPGTDIVVGNKETNFRERTEQELRTRNVRLVEIRTREIRGKAVDAETLEIRETEYRTTIGNELFLEVVTPDDTLAGFLRLSLPTEPSFLQELENAAIVREVHIYGRLAPLAGSGDANAQHAGWGRRLMARAIELATARGFDRLAVISSVGTRGYYRRLGFEDGKLYQTLPL